MSDPILPGDPPIPINLRFSTRARRLSLRVSRLDGRVTLTAPRGVSTGEAMDFARERSDWVRGHLSAFEPARPVDLGTLLPVEGRDRLVRAVATRRVHLTDGSLDVPRMSKHFGSTVEAFLKTLARDRLAVASDGYAQRLGRQVTRLTLRDTRSRWGSCTSAGALMFSWRLILAPPGVLDYVAAHEVAHLVEMNHSARFWKLVDQLRPDWRVERKWLRAHGSGLHSWRFR